MFSMVAGVFSIAGALVISRMGVFSTKYGHPTRKYWEYGQYEMLGDISYVTVSAISLLF